MNAQVEGATVRCRLATLLEREGDAEAAAFEMATAMKVFQQAGAEGLLRSCERLAGTNLDRPRRRRWPSIEKS